MNDLSSFEESGQNINLLSDGLNGQSKNLLKCPGWSSISSMVHEVYSNKTIKLSSVLDYLIQGT